MHVFLQFLLRRKGAIIAVCALCVLSMLAVLAWNNQLSVIINDVSVGKAIEWSTIRPALITIAVISVLYFGQSLASGWTCEALSHDLRTGFARHMSRLPYREAEKLSAGEQISTLQNELNEISAYICDNLFPIFSDAVNFAMTFTWLISLNPRLALLSNLPTIPILLYTQLSSRRIAPLTRESQRANAGMGAFVDSLIVAMPVLKVFDATRVLREAFEAQLHVWERAAIRAEKTTAILMSLSAVLSCLPLAALFLIGGLEVISGAASLGELYVFVNLSGNVSGVLINLPGRIAGYRRFAGNFANLGDRLTPEGRREE